MSGGFDKTNRGSIFENERKEKDTHPDYTGKLNVDGVDYYVSGWAKFTPNGKPFISLSVKPVAGGTQGGGGASRPPPRPPQTQARGGIFPRGGASSPPPSRPALPAQSGLGLNDDDIPF